MIWRTWFFCLLLVLAGVSTVLAENVTVGAKGTEQVPGAIGAIGKAYSLGREGGQLNFTLLGAAYRADQVRLGDEVFYPAAGAKLLVLRYLIHNPERVNQKVFWSAFRFLAVDSTDTTCEAVKCAAQAEDGKKLDILLKPGQKIEALTLIRVAATGVVPKLIVERTAPPVVRYDLRGKVAALPAPYADPADETGATLRDEVPATLKTAYATGVFRTSIDEVSYTTASFGGYRRSGAQFAVVTVTAMNTNTEPEALSYSDFAPRLLMPGEEEAKFVKAVFHATRDEKLTNQKVPAGKTVTVRWCFDCPVAGQAQTLRVAEAMPGQSEGRRFVYTLLPPAAVPAQ